MNNPPGFDRRKFLSCLGLGAGAAATATKGRSWSFRITTSICAATEVIDEVGDDALGWIFAGIQTDLDLATRAIVFGAVGTAGQRCTTLRRVLAHDDVVDAEFEEVHEDRKS